MPSRQRFEVAESTPARRGSRPTRRRSEDRREEILAAAVAPLNRHGLRGMTLAQVGETLGLAPTAVGYYFRRKEDLAAACYLESLRRLSAKVEAAAKEPDSLEAFIRLIFDYRRRVEQGANREIAWFEDVRTIQNPDVDKAYTDFFRGIRSLFGRPQSPADRLSLNVRTHMLLSQIYWAVGWLPQYHSDDYPRMAERMIDVLRNGLASPGRPWPATPLKPDLPDEASEPRQMFLRAATELINEHGYLGASVQKISERLNVTKGAFYHHHDTKSDLVVQCFERSWKIVAAVQAAADKDTDNAYANLASVATFLVGHELSGERPLLRSAALAAVPAELRGELVAGFFRTANRFSSILSDGLSDGSIRPHDIPVGAHLLSGAVNSATELHFWAPGSSPAEAADLFLRPLFTGLFKRP